MTKSPLLCLFVAVIALASPCLAHGDDPSKILGNWTGHAPKDGSAITIKFMANGEFDLSVEDKSGPHHAHGKYAAEGSQSPLKITLNPEGMQVAKTILAILSERQILMQNNQPNQPFPERFTPESVILDKVP